MKMAELVSTRSTCLRRKVGAVIVSKDRNVLATGYNGAPSNCMHCEITGCLRQTLNIPSGQQHEICRAVHAEQNAIIQAAKHGNKIDGAAIYTTTQPCVICAKMIINAGIKTIVYNGDYPDKFSLDLLKEAGINLIKYK
jgi:dCMP deaminase